MVGMPMRLMRLGSTGGIPKPLLFLSNINDYGENLECCISVCVRENIYFVVEFGKFWRRKYKDYLVFMSLSQKLSFYALKRLSFWMVAWCFRKSSPKHQIWSEKT